MKGVYWSVLLGMATAAAIEVDDDAALRAALNRASPGDEIVVSPGVYRGGILVRNRSGTKEHPIRLRGVVTEKMPVLKGGGSSAMQFSNCSYWIIENFVAEGFSGNGFNLDDGGSYETPSRGMILRNLHPFRTGPKGNHDGIKLSGLVDFRIERCRILGWGGSAIDMVGCRDGVVAHCELTGLEGFSQSSGIQMKGGTKRILVEHCRFAQAGSRAVNIGGSTGLQFFRPAVGKFEAEDIEVRDCLFLGSQAPIAFVGSRGGKVHHNLILNPSKWVLRILQEQPVPPFEQAQGGEFYRNVIVLPKDHRTTVNVGINTDPKSFSFRENAWFHQGGQHRPDLPTAEQNGRYGEDPNIHHERVGSEKLAEFGPRTPPPPTH